MLKSNHRSKSWYSLSEGDVILRAMGSTSVLTWAGSMILSVALRIVAVHSAVSHKLLAEPRLAKLFELVRRIGQSVEYDYSTFAFNVQCVNEDANAGAYPASDG